MDIKKLINKYKYEMMISTVLLLFFIIPQIYYTPNWDFMAYYLSGNYFFSKSNYFEVYRAPLTPFLLSILSIITSHKFILTSLLYAVIIISIFLYSSFFLIRTYKLDKQIYYVVLIGTPLFYIYALRVGTELLSLSLIMLALSYRKQNSYVLSGLFFGLASLTRYNYLILLPFFIFVKDWKKSVKFLSIFLISWIPWLYYNYNYFGNILYSLLNSYALNIYFREYLWQQPQLITLPFLGVSLLAIPLLLYFFYKKGWKIMITNNIKEYLIIFVLLFYSYYTTPIKIVRYAYPFILPLVLITTDLLKKIKKKGVLEYLFYTVFLIMIVSAYYYSNIIRDSAYNMNNNPFNTLSHTLNFSSCYYSDMWVHLNFYNIPARPIGELCRGNNIVTIPKCPYALIFFDKECIPENKYETLTPWKLKLYLVSNSSKYNGKPIILDHLQEYSQKLKRNVELEVCESIFKYQKLCYWISKNI